MKKVILTNDTVVRFAKGTVLEVSDQEAKRLIVFKNAVEAEEPVEEKKAQKKKASAKSKA